MYKPDLILHEEPAVVSIHFLKPCAAVPGTVLTVIVKRIQMNCRASWRHQTKNPDATYQFPDLTGIFIGTGNMFSSWVPYLVSQRIIERAVEKYNRDPRVRNL